MFDAEVYLERAREALALANQETEAMAKAALLDIAEAWAVLAEEYRGRRASEAAPAA